VYDTADELAPTPGIGRLREFEVQQLRELRSFPVDGFRNFLLFYIPTAEGIQVLRILHGARDLESEFE
jgi:toxin ParE1/3/4